MRLINTRATVYIKLVHALRWTSNLDNINTNLFWSTAKLLETPNNIPNYLIYRKYNEND